MERCRVVVEQCDPHSDLNSVREFRTRTKVIRELYPKECVTCYNNDVIRQWRRNLLNPASQTETGYSANTMPTIPNQKFSSIRKYLRYPLTSPQLQLTKFLTSSIVEPTPIQTSSGKCKDTPPRTIQTKMN
jgi:hypothetical protein